MTKQTPHEKRIATMLERHGPDVFKERSRKAAATAKKNYGQDYHKKLGRKGGTKKHEAREV